VTTVEFLPRAEKDLLALPPDLQDEILSKIEVLQEFPQIGPRMERVFSQYRYILAGKNRYRIIYKIIPSGKVQIAYIRHCRRQLGLRVVH
jgi:plasmid stabilization system protein ParE